MAYKVAVDVFEGPFDLLLYLIEKEEIDVFDIPIADITSQYFEYLDQWKDMDIEITSEFIYMASRLLEIKSKMLLPVEEEKEIEEDPREELARRLYEYKVFKEIGVYLKSKEGQYHKFFYKDPEYIPVHQLTGEIETEQLAAAFRKILSRKNLLDEMEEYKGYKVYKENIRLEDRIAFIYEQVSVKSRLSFQQLFAHSKSIQSVVVTFLAILELIKTNVIDFQQNDSREDIVLFRL
ncbi:MAG TPA: chromosome segregation protein ScpA [Eubacteriaceae bacterium]|nr:chromosome segregation protein ScpA [Eubacteriaceae bacterium]